MKKLDKLNELVIWFDGLNWDIQIIILIILIAFALTRMDTKRQIENNKKS
ncbi:MAG TPA: hypothetical protein VIK26_03105 [Clostridium sp.]